MLQRIATSSRLLGPRSLGLSAASHGTFHGAVAKYRHDFLQVSPRCIPSQAVLGCAASQTRRHAYSTRAALSQPTSPMGTLETVTETQPIIHSVFEKVTGTWQYIVADAATASAAIIDPVLDYDPYLREIKTTSADELLSIVRENGYKVDRILETHIHADHITAAAYLQHALRDHDGDDGGNFVPSIGIGKRIGLVQKLFSKRYCIPDDEMQNVHQCLFEDDEIFHIGRLDVQAIHLPGHTPDHMGYKIGDNIFCGDSLFITDLGSSRCDFPGGSAKQLYESGRKLLGFPDHVKIWTGHDYPPPPPSEHRRRREPLPFQSVAEHRASNKHLMKGVSRDEFVAMRETRDATLAEPRLLHPSLQINVRGGKLPKLSWGHRMIQTPITVVNGGAW